jgi:hypothetical protein
MFNALGFLLASQNILFSSGLHVEVNTSRSYHNINNMDKNPKLVLYPKEIRRIVIIGDLHGVPSEDQCSWSCQGINMTVECVCLR